MTAQPPNSSVDNLDLMPQRQLTIASLVPALLWRRLSQDSTDALPIGDFQGLDAIVVQMRLYGPSNPLVMGELDHNVPSVIAVAYNTLYAYLVSAITTAGGFLVEMTMYHLTAVFPIASETKAAQTFQTLTGIEDAIATARGKTPAGYPNIRWHASAGISYGKVTSAILGNEFLGRKLMIVGGEAKIQSEDALELTRRGQIVVHRSILKLLGTAPDGEWLSEDFFAAAEAYREGNLGETLNTASARLPATRAGTPPSTLLQAHRLAAFLDSRIRTRSPFVPLQRGQVAQRIACLTLRLVGMGLDDEYAVEPWQTAIDRIFEIASRFGGMVDSVATEMGIGEIRLIFGLPDEQDFLERQVARCALALNRSLASLDPLLRIGIATGRGFAALLGTRFYSNYVVISTAIDHANQFAERAEAREILGDATIQAATSNLFTWREQRSSLPDQTKIYALAGEVSLGSGLAVRHQVTKQEPLIGRYAERDLLDQHVQQAREGQGHIVLITGQTGNGRSTLIDYVIGKWFDDGGNGFVSLGPTYSPSTPYSLWRPIWQAIFDLRQDETAREKMTKLSRAFSRILPDADGGVALFANLLGLTVVDDGSLKYLPPTIRERRLFDATQTLLSQLADMSPLLLVFEHTEYSDDPSLKLLKDMASALRRKPVLFCVEDRRNVAHTLTKYLPKAATVEAKPFTGSEAWQLLKAKFPQMEWPFSYQQALEQMLGSPDENSQRQYSPVFVSTLATTFEHGFLVKEDSSPTQKLNPKLAQDIPTDELEAAAWLLKHVLTPRQRRVITKAAANGIRFPHQADWLADVAGGSPAVEIEYLEQIGFVQRYLDSDTGERWSRFRHESLREALYAELDVPARVELHRSIINWYKRYTPGNASMSTVAAHAERAGWSQEAVHAYLKAATFAIEWGATSEALQCLLAAERHLAHTAHPRPDLLFDLALTRAKLHLVHEQYEAGRAQAEKALSYAETANNALGMARSLLFLAQFAQYENDRATMDQATKRALSLAREAQDARIITEASWLRAKALMASNQRREAVQLLVNALEEGTIDDDELELEMRIDVARILLVDYYRERARDHVQRLYEQTINLDNPVIIHQVMAQYGHVQLLYGKVSDALHSLERALALPPPPKASMSALGEVLVHHGVALCYAGRYMDAGAVFDAAIDYFESENNDAQIAYARLMQAAELHLDRQNWDLVQQTLNLLDDSAEAIEKSLRRDEIAILRDLLQLSLDTHRNKFESAQIIAERLLERPDSSAKRWFYPLIFIRCAQLRLAQEAYDDACRHAYKALGSVSTQGDIRYLADSYTTLAESLVLRGDLTGDAIRDALERAINSGRQHGRRIHLARALLLMGYYLQQTSHLHRTRARGGSFLFEAEQIYKEMGLAPPENMGAFKKVKSNHTPALTG